MRSSSAAARPPCRRFAHAEIARRKCDSSGRAPRSPSVQTAAASRRRDVPSSTASEPRRTSPRRAPPAAARQPAASGRAPAAARQRAAAAVARRPHLEKRESVAELATARARPEGNVELWSEQRDALLRARGGGAPMQRRDRRGRRSPASPRRTRPLVRGRAPPPAASIPRARSAAPRDRPTPGTSPSLPGRRQRRGRHSRRAPPPPSPSAAAAAAVASNRWRSERPARQSPRRFEALSAVYHVRDDHTLSAAAGGGVSGGGGGGGRDRQAAAAHGASNSLR